jgi:hypothetical protein
MRILMIFLLSVLATPAFAQGWERYENARHGYSLEVPPGFEPQGESGNGDGQAFSLAGKPIDLTVWGGMLLDDFESEVGRSMELDQSDGWIITNQTTTSRWASYGASKGSRVLFERMVLLCDGASHAVLRVEYSRADTPLMQPLIDTMAPSLRGTAC